MIVALYGIADVFGADPAYGPGGFQGLCPLHTLTSGPYNHTHAYPTARTWSQDNMSVFVEDPGPGPDGVVQKNARHLEAINIETGKKQYIATTHNSDPDKPAGWFMFDFAPAANCIVYANGDSSAIWMKNLTTGKSGEVFSEPEGEISGPLTVAWDGTRVVWWTMFPSKENRFFDNYITVIMGIDVDPAECKATGEPFIIEAYPRRKLANWDENHRAGVHVNHPQINPKNKDHICYSHEMLGAVPNGTVEMSRLWQSMVTEDYKQYLIRQPAGLHFTHEVIAPDGKSLIFPYFLGVGQVFFGDYKGPDFPRRSLYYNPDCCPGHVTISPDQQWIAGDTWGKWKDDKGKVWQSIMMFEVSSRKWAHICWFKHSHPHPIFSQDGKKIAFSYRDENEYQQVAWIDVTDVERRWDEVYQGVGEQAGPAWIEGVGDRMPAAE